MLQKKAFAGKPLAAKPVQVRSVDLAGDPAGAARFARLGVLRRCQSLHEALHLRGSPAPLCGRAPARSLIGLPKGRHAPVQYLRVTRPAGGDVIAQ